MILVYSPRCLDYAAPGHPERPERVRSAVSLLRRGKHEWIEPEPCSDDDILLVHSPALLESLKTNQWFDLDTPVFPNIYEIARWAAGAAILAGENALKHGRAFSLMRPPGHHAERNRIMGFCYLNNIAIAVSRLFSRVNRLAVLDFDCHHGNGTEDIFFGSDRVMFASIHQSPCYPGTGLVSRRNCVNYPLPPGATPSKFLDAIDDALEKLSAFEPALLAVSAGFDAYRGDPITHMNLEIETYREIGERIRRAARIPTFAVLEGGYSDDFAQCVNAFVEGLS
jgi:acetoin utilization deacetylase AcuC-like enzyme